MADDERRAEIEAVAEAIHAAEAEHSWLVGEGRIGAWRFASDDLKDLRRRQARAALDRVRDARGDDEAAVWRSMLARIRIHGASGLWNGEDCAIGAVAALEGEDAGRTFMLEREAARQGEDHEAGVAMPVFTIKAKDNLAVETIRSYRKLCLLHDLNEQAHEVDAAIEEIVTWRLAHPDLCKWPDHKHVSASPASGTEPEVAVEDVAKLVEALRRIVDLGPYSTKPRYIAQDALAEFTSPASTRRRTADG